VGTIDVCVAENGVDRVVEGDTMSGIGSRFPLASATCALMLMLIGSGVAAAAVPEAARTGFGAGMFHPLHELDHVLAAIVVGMWAAQLGGRAIAYLPCAFIASLLAVLPLSGSTGDLLLGHSGIFAAVLVAGAIIALQVRLPLHAATAVAAAAGALQGLDDAAELSGMAFGLVYVVGLAIATGALHGVGLAIGIYSQPLARRWVLRGVGAVAAGLGAALMIG
jgi:urease accessory protein